MKDSFYYNQVGLGQSLTITKIIYNNQHHTIQPVLRILGVVGGSDMIEWLGVDNIPIPNLPHEPTTLDPILIGLRHLSLKICSY